MCRCTVRVQCRGAKIAAVMGPSAALPRVRVNVCVGVFACERARVCVCVCIVLFLLSDGLFRQHSEFFLFAWFLSLKRWRDVWSSSERRWEHGEEARKKKLEKRITSPPSPSFFTCCGPFPALLLYIGLCNFEYVYNRVCLFLPLWFSFKISLSSVSLFFFFCVTLVSHGCNQVMLAVVANGCLPQREHLFLLHFKNTGLFVLSLYVQLGCHTQEV